MCGITGCIDQNKNRDKIERVVRIANNIIEHRGPDSDGIYIDEQAGLGLAHRRLSILDLSADGHQPMHFESRLTITYNGEIYNYIELKQTLIELGYRFKSTSDTEVILASYAEWGTDCVNKFNGMWAFALYDHQKKIVFCSRDRFGIKPFFYCKYDSYFIFGSEIKQLLTTSISRNVNLRTLRDYLVIGLTEHGEETFFENILSLPGGHNLIYDLEVSRFDIKRWYSISLDDHISNLSETESVEYYQSKLLSSVELRLRSDVTVGTCLSGGLDSSSIAASAAKLHQDKSNFKAIHAKASEHQLDESSYAQSTADHSGIELVTIEPSLDDFLGCIDDVVYTQEEPFSTPSIVMQYLVMKQAKELGIRVMLDGQGGDETLLGYERYYPAYIRSLPLAEKVGALLKSKKNSSLSIVQLIGYLVYFTQSMVRKARLKRKFKFLNPKFIGDLSWIDRLSTSYTSILELQTLEIQHTQLPHLLRYEDRNSMRHSVEARLPFLDYRLLETSLSLNNNLKIRNGWTKFILREAMKSILPDSVVWRKNKLGFNSPEKTWLGAIKSEMHSRIRGSKLLNSICQESLELKKMDNKTIFKLYIIAKWEEQFNVIC